MFATAEDSSGKQPAGTAAPPAPASGEDAPASGDGARGRRLARSTAFFSFATGLSRVLGLVREVVAASVFGVTGAMSAFTIAFQVPNLIRALFADSALQGAFVPVFTELLEKGERKEAFRVASSLFFLICIVLGSLTLLFIIFARPIMGLFAPGFDDNPHLADLTVNLSRLMFPIVLMLALSGVVVGMLNSFEHFSVPALAPVAWNLVIIGALAGLVPVLPVGHKIYAYAIGVLAGTVVQFLLPLPWLRGRGGHFTFTLDWKNPRVLKVLKLMLPVTLALGLINLSLLINSIFATLVSSQAPAAIDKAFRIYQLPQGLFSISIATILFPTMSRFAARGAHDDLRRTMANGVRQVCMLLIPSAVLMAVLAHPITQLVYQRGAFTPHATNLVSTAMVWWSISLPFQGVSLLFSRTFFSLQQPWFTTALSVINLAVNAAVAALLYKPLGIAGIVLGTVTGTMAMCVAQGAVLRRELGGVEGRRTALAAIRMLLAGALLAGVSYGLWHLLDSALGTSLPAQILSVGGAIAAGLAVYGVAVWLMRIPEARQLRTLLPGG
ncbi:MAG TPA: murein biosynthesis integral membrane protein MurJ [Thermoleophilaceae bacterium]|nr:murein biosynthesis integral membrane protein MurJ [Thermoleophilaceae bacterium]